MLALAVRRLGKRIKPTRPDLTRSNPTVGVFLSRWLFRLFCAFFFAQSELQALLKRIDARRKEHIKQRNLDSKRLLQRNRNVQTVLESKQNVEGLKLTEEIKKVWCGVLSALNTQRGKCIAMHSPLDTFFVMFLWNGGKRVKNEPCMPVDAGPWSCHTNLCNVAGTSAFTPDTSRPLPLSRTLAVPSLARLMPIVILLSPHTRRPPVVQSVMGTVPGVASMPPDPSQKIPPEARGRVRRKKKSSSAGMRASTAAGGGVGEGDANRTFVTSGGFPGVDHPSVMDGQAA